MASTQTQNPSNSSSGPSSSSKPAAIPASKTLSLSSFKPSEWRVQVISSTSTSSNSSDSRSGPILAGRCYDFEQINQYYCPENSEVFDLGGVGDQSFYIKFERILDHHPTYVVIHLDEILTDHFYIPPTEKWAISQGWQENPQSPLSSYVSWNKNPRLVGHIIIRFYHLSEEETKDLREVYITKRPFKCRNRNPKLNVYAVLDQNPTAVSPLSPRKQRLPRIPMKVPYHFIYLRYDDGKCMVAHYDYKRLMKKEEYIHPKRGKGLGDDSHSLVSIAEYCPILQTPELKSESESDINHYTLHPAPRTVKSEPKPKLKPKIKPNNYPTIEEFESEPDINNNNHFKPTKAARLELIPEEHESDSDYTLQKPGPTSSAKSKLKPKPKSKSKSKQQPKLKSILVTPRRPLPHLDLDLDRDDTTALAASTSRTTVQDSIRVRDNNSNRINHSSSSHRRPIYNMDRHVAMEDLESGGEILRRQGQGQGQGQRERERERERRHDDIGSRNNVKGENEDSGDEVRRRQRQRQRQEQRERSPAPQRPRPAVEPRSSQQQRVPRERQQRQQGESDMMQDINFHMKEIWRILGNETWKNLFG